MVRVAGCTLRSRARSHVTEDHPQPHRTAPSAHDVQQRALMRHHLTTAARLPLLPPARESTPVTYCPRPLHGFRCEALRKPSCRESDDGLLKSGMAVRRVPREAPGGVRERPPVLTTAASRQAKHHPVYPGTRTVRGATRDRLGGAWRLTEDALLKSERLRFIYTHATSQS